MAHPLPGQFEYGPVNRSTPDSAELVVMEREAVAVDPTASETSIENADVSVVAGTPDITPVFPVRVSPDGRSPEVTVQEYGAVPPVAARVAEYPMLTFPEGKEPVVIVGGAVVPEVSMMTAKVAVAELDAASVAFTVTDDVPAVVGVPEITPFEVRDNPAGRLPDDIAHV